ncbi:MAG: phospholipase A [Oceanobacter sp.]
MWLKFLVLFLCLAQQVIAQEVKEASENALEEGSIELLQESLIENPSPEIPLLEDRPLKKEMIEIPVVSREEFKPSIRENLPALIDRERVESIAAHSPYVLLPHRPNFFLPFTYVNKPNEQVLNRQAEYYGLDRNAQLEYWEMMMQFSIKYQLMTGLLTKLDRIEIGYTNRSFWQAYNSAMSRPFRETNHEPEIIYSWSPSIQFLDAASIAFNHHSNGQTGPLSRSWNRVIFNAASFRSFGAWSVTAWWRIPETNKSDPEDPSDNDNPDIQDYLGYGELNYLRTLGKSNVHVRLRNNFDWEQNRGAIELNYSFPLTKRVKGYLYFFNGYGESLIDYDHYQRRIGLGFKLSDWI